MDNFVLTTTCLTNQIVIAKLNKNRNEILQRKVISIEEFIYVYLQHSFEEKLSNLKINSKHNQIWGDGLDNYFKIETTKISKEEFDKLNNEMNNKDKKCQK